MRATAASHAAAGARCSIVLSKYNKNKKWQEERRRVAYTAAHAYTMQQVSLPEVLTSSTGTCRTARVAARPRPTARYARRPQTARPQADPGCLRIRRARQTGGVASNSAVGISNRGISPTGFNGVPYICPRNYTFPLTDPQTPLPASSLAPYDLPCQTASGSDPPFVHNALDRHTDPHTDRQTDR